MLRLRRRAAGREDSSPITAARIAAIGAIVAAAVGAVITESFGLLSSQKGPKPPIASGGGSTNKKVCVAGGVVLQGSRVDCSPQAKGRTVPKTADAGCGTVGGKLGQPSVQLTVLMWCAPQTVRGQYEYKLKVAVKNTGRVRLDISRQRFLLLWRSVDPHEWSPPARGSPAPPRRISYGGAEYWAISANLDGIAEAGSADVGPTFATHWNHTSLPPRDSSLHLRKGYHTLSFQNKQGTVVKTVPFNFHEDDLVFYVPADAVDQEDNFLGLGFESGGRIIAVCPQDQWGPRVPPNVF